MLYEEFFSDPATHYAELMRFLGLAPVPTPAFSIVNEYVGVRSHRLERLLRRPPEVVRVLYAPFRPLLHAVGLHPVQLVKRMNWGRPRKTALRAAFRAELEDYFSGEVAEAERLLGRRLWSSPIDAVE